MVYRSVLDYQHLNQELNIVPSERMVKNWLFRLFASLAFWRTLLTSRGGKKRCLHLSALKVDMDYELKNRPSSHVPYYDIRCYVQSFNHKSTTALVRTFKQRLEMCTKRYLVHHPKKLVSDKIRIRLIYNHYLLFSQHLLTNLS